jgi:MYXO-CTERM domain-containing protein
VFVFAFLFATATAVAADFYVATDGSDTGAGTLSAPFATLAHGLASMAGGDTLYVRDGTYPEELYGNIKAGTEAQPTRVMAYAGERPTLRPPEGSRRVLHFENPQAWIEVEGFVLDATNVTYDAVKITYTGSGEDVAHHITIRDCEAFGSPGQGFLVTRGHSNLLTGLEVHHNGTDDFDHGFYISGSDNVVESSDIYENAGWGIHGYSASWVITGNVFRSNWIHDNGTTGRGPGIGLYSGEGHVAVNNVIFGNNQGIQVDYGAVGAIVAHNTVVNNRGSAIYVGVGSPGVIVANNLMWGNDADRVEDAADGTVTGVNLTVDPMFVDEAGLDFHLLDGSPAIDAAEDLGVSDDFDGVARPWGDAADVGAYEWFELPDDPVDDSGLGDTAAEDTGDSTDDTHAGEDPAGDSDESDTDVKADSVPKAGGGCGCATGQAPRGAWMGLVLLAIIRRWRW